MLRIWTGRQPNRSTTTRCLSSLARLNPPRRPKRRFSTESPLLEGCLIPSAQVFLVHGKPRQAPDNSGIPDDPKLNRLLRVSNTQDLGEKIFQHFPPAPLAELGPIDGMYRVSRGIAREHKELTLEG